MTQRNVVEPEMAFSAKYDSSHANAYFEKHNAGVMRRISNWRDHQIARKALQLAGNPKSVLDVPCGTGRFWELLAEDPDRIIHASDYSQDMINTGLKYRPVDITSKIHTFKASAFALPVSDNYTECIFCIRLIHHIGKSDERRKLLTELHRVSAATVIISLWVDGNFKAWRRKIRESRRTRNTFQNRFIIPAKTIEQEFGEAGFHIKARLNFLPFYSMWRVYVLQKH